MKKNLFVILIRCILIALYMLSYWRYAKAKKIDPSLKPKFDLRSLTEIMIVSGVNLGVLILPINDNTRGLILVVGQVMLLLTFFHLSRFVVFGKKVVFLKENPFAISDIKNFKYEKGRMKFMVKHVPLKIFLPISDMNYIGERLSGKYFRR